MDLKKITKKQKKAIKQLLKHSILGYGTLTYNEDDSTYFCEFCNGVGKPYDDCDNFEHSNDCLVSIVKPLL